MSKHYPTTTLQLLDLATMKRCQINITLIAQTYLSLVSKYIPGGLVGREVSEVGHRIKEKCGRNCSLQLEGLTMGSSSGSLDTLNQTTGSQFRFQLQSFYCEWWWLVDWRFSVHTQWYGCYANSDAFNYEPPIEGLDGLLLALKVFRAFKPVPSGPLYHFTLSILSHHKSLSPLCPCLSPYCLRKGQPKRTEPINRHESAGQFEPRRRSKDKPTNLQTETMTARNMNVLYCVVGCKDIRPTTTITLMLTYSSTSMNKNSMDFAEFQLDGRLIWARMRLLVSNGRAGSKEGRETPSWAARQGKEERIGSLEKF